MRKMASKTFLAVMLLIVVFFISGCGSSNGGNVKKAAYEIIDDQGAMIQLEHKPERILTLAMGTDSIVLGILPEEKLIAINSLADDPVSSNIVDKANGITRKIKNPSAEEILSLKPDVVFIYNWGINYGDPKVKGTKKPYWDRKYGRWQLNGGINYTKDKWITSLQGTYLAQRVETPSSKQSFSEKPYFLTSLTTTYNADKQNSISLTLDNLLNREDNLSHSGSEYYSTPFNFLLSYNYKF
jgi:hypothetical protein